MSFGVLFQYRPQRRQDFEEERFSGCCREAPFSSIMAEIMTVFVALAEVGLQRMLETETDSQAAIEALEAIQHRDPERPWHSSLIVALPERPYRRGARRDESTLS
ncbi:hypothetical protein IW140_003697, partial [Coemansia sp. RSA 1813]